MSTTVHIINHTHWDREWFLTSEYTSQWIPNLVDTLEELIADNPDFRFLLDGQTLVIEDLLEIAPAYRDKIDRMVANGNLIIGPYYCQPDWRLTGGECLIRNLRYGQQDVRAYGGGDRADVGWLVDIFGHISQEPQLHRLFNVDVAFIWRGAPRLEPYFSWQGADGGRLFTVNLFGGYRNLYGVTRTPELAKRRLETEVAKLKPFYPTDDIPLFDGYDLEQNPEDPARFFQKQAPAMPARMSIEQSSPDEFVSALMGKLQSLPVIVGELNSGKYGATFPGTLSSRTYLKIMHRDCEQLLYTLCEPLAVLARLKGRDYEGRKYEAWGRKLLQNSVHDCICGVSIDQVHERMELSYRNLFSAAKKDILDSLAYILKGFKAGDYAVSTNPFDYEGWHADHDRVWLVRTNGVGVWEVGPSESLDVSPKVVGGFDWRNDYYSATVRPDGTVQVGEATLGYLVVTGERGDAYSSEEDDRRAVCKTNGPIVVERANPHYCEVRYECSLQWEAVFVSATVRLVFDQTPLLSWQVDLDSRGTDFRVDMVFDTAQRGDIYAGMPFDVVNRPSVDQDLLPRQLEPRLAKTLLGQRELNEVRTFPFQDFVVVSDNLSSAAVFAQGLHAYRAGNGGTISLTLRRSVEYLTRSDLEYRAGDAGPHMYVPDARCERVVRHKIAVMIGNVTLDDPSMHRLNAGFQNPPVIVDHQGEGGQGSWQFLRADLPLSSLHIYHQSALARFYNPTNRTQPLGDTFLKTDVWGNPETSITEVGAKEIVTAMVSDPASEVSTLSDEASFAPIIWPSWRVAQNRGHPDLQIIEQLEAHIGQLEARLVEIEEEVERASGSGQYTLKHMFYVLKRKLYELRLSVLLNKRKLAASNRLADERLHAPDPEVAQLGLKLNELRIKRRIYDYVIAALPDR
jgi:alpha-mannosidase